MKRLIMKLLIPRGMYCYRGDYVCPFWFRDSGMDEQENGYCSYLNMGDNELGMGLLWDMVKECGVKGR